MRTDELKEWVKAEGQKVWLEIRMKSLPQCDALIMAGWKFYPQSENSEPWQWYWRRPARRKGSGGMLFLSTQQAYNALMKEKAINS